jgi:hypothetical protein
MTKFTLKEHLTAHFARPFDLARALKGRVSQDTIYKICQEKTQGIDLATLNQVLWAMNKILEIPTDVSDIVVWDGVEGGNPRRNGVYAV